MLPPSELSQLGFTLAAYPFATLNPAIVAMREALRALRSEAEDATATRARLGLPFAELQRVVGFPEYHKQEARYKTK
jgi:2-methylisocitrate lyase-like PEP mutase family enzyme